mgnify:FL=1
MEQNYLKLDIKAVLDNVSVVRVAIATFISNMDITIDELMDVKTAVSEAVTNSIEHGYDEYNKGNVKVEAYIIQDEYDIIKIIVEDTGVGIEDIELATTPAYTSKPEMEHAGMGFTIMESFMDEILIDSVAGQGTKITLIKKIKEKKST